MKNLLLPLALAAGAFVAWNWYFGKTKRANSAYPENWDSLTALQQRAYLRQFARASTDNESYE